MTLDHRTLRDLSAVDVRAAIRSEGYRGHTAGLGEGCLQTNIVILPSSFALDFMRYCQRNPKPCPLVGVTDTGDAQFRTMGRDINVRTDVPAYNVYRDGRLVQTVSSIGDLWTQDLVAFALGCSFTFEHALERAGIPVWHVQHDTTVPMYRTKIDTVPAGPFRGKMVVSMRPIPIERVDEVRQICAAFPLAHGAPVHVGDPALIGIGDIARPDWGDPVRFDAGTVPVFWACGVTPQVAVEAARPPICITHVPGHMLITDIAEDAEVPILVFHEDQKSNPTRRT